MQKKEYIINSIRILNETFNSDFLKIKKININSEIIKKIIRKKKMKFMRDIFDDLSISLSLNNKNIQNITNDTKNSESDLSPDSNSESNLSSIINDSIMVTNFTIPSSIYKKSQSQSQSQSQTQNQI
jgi:hypothetical protein